jgi:hypothetical protein
MAAVLILGAIPSGLTGTVGSATGLYSFESLVNTDFGNSFPALLISSQGILEATFVPCQVWCSYAWHLHHGKESLDFLTSSMDHCFRKYSRKG